MSDKNETTIVNALRVAAEQYDRDAKFLREEAQATDPPATPEQALGLNRLAVQFDTQAFDCRELADKIEQSGLDQVGVPVSRLRYCVDGHEYPDTESNLAGDGQHPPFRVFDIDAQDYLPGVYATRAEAEAALPGSTEQRATVRLTPSCVLRWLRLKP